MFKLSHLISLLLMCVIFAQTAAAQNANQNRAKAKYYSAEIALKENRVDDALSAVKDAEELLGQTNALLEATKVRIYYRQGELDKANSALNNVYNYDVSPKLLKRIARYEDRISSEISQNRDRKKWQAEEAERQRERVRQAELEAERIIEFRSDIQNFEYTAPNGIPYDTHATMQAAITCAETFVATIAEDTDAAPCVRIPPIMPPIATQSGHCLVTFDVNRLGHTENLVVMGCTEVMFRDPTILAIKRWFYTPKVSDGLIVPRPGVQSKVAFRLTNEIGELIPEPLGVFVNF